VNGIVMGRGVEYRYKLIQQHYESDDISFPGESILHLQRREGIVGSLKVGACICLRWVSKHQIPYHLDAYGFR